VHSCSQAANWFSLQSSAEIARRIRNPVNRRCADAPRFVSRHRLLDTKAEMARAAGDPGHAVTEELAECGIAPLLQIQWTA